MQAVSRDVVSCFEPYEPETGTLDVWQHTAKNQPAHNDTVGDDNQGGCVQARHLYYEASVHKHVSTREADRGVVKRTDDVQDIGSNKTAGAG